MKKIIIAVIGAVMLTAVLCFAACTKGGRVDDKTSSTSTEPSSSGSDVLGNDMSDIGDDISEGISDAGDAIKDGVSDVSEKASDVAEDIKDDLDMESSSSDGNN